MLKSILIDDELNACKALQTIIDTYFSSQIKVIGIAQSCLEAIPLIHDCHPDIVFLDINMPQGSGFDLFKFLPSPDFDVIFVTAHDSYAIEAIKVEAKDYLLKPIDIDELGSTIQKIYQKRCKKNYPEQNNDRETIALPTQDGLTIIRVLDISYCESESNYTTIHLRNGGKHVVSKTLKEYEHILPNTQFIRIHRSYIVQINQIEKYIKGSGGFVTLYDKTSLPVSRAKKDELLDTLC